KMCRTVCHGRCSGFTAKSSGATGKGDATPRKYLVLLAWVCKNGHMSHPAELLESAFARLHPPAGHHLDGCRRACRVSGADFSVPVTEIVENGPLFASLSAFCLHISIETGMQCAEP